MIKRLVLVVAVLALLFGSVFGWKYLQMRAQASKRGGPPAAVVSTRSAVLESWQPALAATGTVVPTRGVVVAAEVAGVVREVHFDSGQIVPADELLVELDAEVDRAELAALQADRRLAEITQDRFAQIVADDLGSRSDLDAAEATLDRIEAELAAKQSMIRKKSVRTPFAGELGIRRINPGQYLDPGDEIVELVALDPIFVEYSLPERYLAELALDQPVTVRVQPYPDAEFGGKIHAISPIIQTTSRSVRIRALLDNPDRRLRPGMFAQVQTLMPERNNVLTVPERAVSYNPYGESVFVVDDVDGRQTVRLVQIETGEVRNGRVEVESGLEEGVQVVSDGHGKLRNGQPIEIDNSVDPDAVDPRR